MPSSSLKSDRVVDQDNLRPLDVWFVRSYTLHCSTCSASPVGRLRPPHVEVPRLLSSELAESSGWSSAKGIKLPLVATGRNLIFQRSLTLCANLTRFHVEACAGHLQRNISSTARVPGCSRFSSISIVLWKQDGHPPASLALTTLLASAWPHPTLLQPTKAPS